MIKLDDNLLAGLGLAILPPEEKKRLLAHIYETLEMRVGVELAKQMTEAQLNEFEEFIKRNDEAGALKWLETNFPNYKDVVAGEFEKLKAEVKQSAPQIIASVQNQPPMPQPMPGYYAPQPGYAPQYGGMPPQQMPYPASPAGYPAAPQPYQPQPYYPQQQPMQQPGQPMFQQPMQPQPMPQPMQQPAQQPMAQPQQVIQPAITQPTEDAQQSQN
jgi:hypothetical protein